MLPLYSSVTYRYATLNHYRTLRGALSGKRHGQWAPLSSEQKWHTERGNVFFMVPPCCVVVDSSRLISVVAADIQVITPWTSLAAVHKNYGAPTRKAARVHSIGTNRTSYPQTDLFLHDITRVYIIPFVFVLEHLMTTLLFLI
jgi:hypothetical protein